MNQVNYNSRNKKPIILFLSFFIRKIKMTISHSFLSIETTNSIAVATYRFISFDWCYRKIIFLLFCCRKEEERKLLLSFQYTDELIDTACGRIDTSAWTLIQEKKNQKKENEHDWRRKKIHTKKWNDFSFNKIYLIFRRSLFFFFFIYVESIKMKSQQR